MAVLEIRKYNDPVLRKKSEEVVSVDNATRELISSMIETMAESQGLGLAAPQVGVNKRVIVIRTDWGNPSFLTLINPRVIEKSRETETGEEGCLSFPGVFLKIKRPKRVKISGLGRNKNKMELGADGLLARVLQHEIDHLDGILFYDRLSFGQRMKFNLNRLIRGFNRKSN